MDRVSLSESPTIRPKEERLRRFVGRVKMVASLLGLLGGAYAAAVRYQDSFTTDDELAGAISAHDLSPDAHAALLARIGRLETLTAKLKAESDQTRLLWRVLIGYEAADRERDRRLAAAAAAHYREVFDQYIWGGNTALEAYRLALKDPWIDRPRTRR